LDACIAAGIDPRDWLSGEVHVKVKSKVMAWHRLQELIEMHSQEAVNNKQEQEAKKKTRK